MAGGALSQRISVNFGSGFQNGKEIGCAGFGGTTPKYESAAGRPANPSQKRIAGGTVLWLFQEPALSAAEGAESDARDPAS